MKRVVRGAALAERRDDDHSVAESYRKAGPWIDASWQLIGSVAGLTLLGWWLDGRFKTKPWLLVTGACLGMVVGFYSFFRAVIALSKKEKQ